jgi:diguanylate cyclase (GGDEF)-like protein
VNILDLLDAGMPPRLRLITEQRNRGRIVVAVSALNLLLSGLLFVLFTVTTLWPGASRDKTLLLNGVAFAAYGACLLLFRLTGSFVICGNLFGASAYIILLMAVILMGGFSESPAVVLLLLVPVYVSMLTGRNSVLAWSLVVAVTTVVLYMLERCGVHFTQMLPSELVPMASLVIFLAALIVIVGSLLVSSQISGYHEHVLHTERDQLDYMAHHDALTELPNRSYFLSRLGRSVARARRNDEHSALLYIDLDGFKPINDEHGHSIGDVVLRKLAARLRDVIRENDTVARLGGDEFAVILEDVRDREFAASVAQKLLQQLSEPVIVGDDRFAISGSVGIVMFPEQGSDIAQLCEQADQAMYRAKEKRNAAVFY